jgi:hypothetical protein
MPGGAAVRCCCRGCGRRRRRRRCCCCRRPRRTCPAAAQLESRKLRRLWFVEAAGKEVVKTEVISYDYALLPTLLN